MVYESDHSGITHYLNDFLFIGPPNSLVCSLILRLFFLISKFFCIPLATDKTAFPSPLHFLGINTLLFQYEPPSCKIDRIQSLISFFLHRKKILLKELQSFLGPLAFFDMDYANGKNIFQETITSRVQL